MQYVDYFEDLVNSKFNSVNIQLNLIRFALMKQYIYHSVFAPILMHLRMTTKRNSIYRKAESQIRSVLSGVKLRKHIG